MALGLDGEEILNTFYNRIDYTRQTDGSWRMPFDGARLKGTKASYDLIDADSGDVVVEGGRKITARTIRQLSEKGVTALKVTDEDLHGQYLAEDIVDMQSGEIFAEAGGEITGKLLEELIERGYDELTMLDIDHVNTGPYIRNTLSVDKNESPRRCALRHLSRHASR